jgi:hypothetical protein
MSLLHNLEVLNFNFILLHEKLKELKQPREL